MAPAVHSTMRRATRPLLRCVEPPRSGSRSARSGQRGGASARCDGSLAPSLSGPDLVCNRCGADYPVVGPTAQILPSPRTPDNYHYDEIIRTYYEAHFGPFLNETPELQARLTFPHPDFVARAAGGVPVESFAELRRNSGAEERATPPAFYDAIATLGDDRQLTEPFYQFILDLCRPYVNAGTVALDVGCGLGRVTVELARLGVKLALGVDRSPQMVNEAQRILRAPGPVEVALNLTAERSVPACVSLPWAPPKNLDFIVGDATRLPLRAESFDLVTNVNLLDRVHEPDQMVEEIGRVLRPGGHLLIADPYHWEEGYTKRERWVEDLTTLFDPSLWKRVREVDGIPFALRYYSRRVSVYMNHCAIFEKISEPMA